MQAHTGQLHVVCGCMWAGKSTEACSTVRRWRSLHKHVLAAKHACDTRYGHAGLFTHDTALAPVDCVPVTHLLPLRETADYARADVVVVEEAQFFDDLYEFCRHAVDDDCKTVYVYGLDGNARREDFGQLTRLCSLADTFTKRHALCQMCKDGTPAPFTVALIPLPVTGVLVGGSETYAAVCRRHYNLHSQQDSAGTT